MYATLVGREVAVVITLDILPHSQTVCAVLPEDRNSHSYPYTSTAWKVKAIVNLVSMLIPLMCTLDLS
jgi:hypothetical protein